MRVLNFGSANIDYVYSMPHFVKAGETVSSLNMERFLGGKGLNQSIAVAKSGTEVFHAGCIGSDGAFLRDALENAGVDVTYLKTLDVPTGHAIIQVSGSGENCIIIHGGANRAITKEYADEVLSHFAAGDIIILQNEVSNLSYIIEKAAEKGMQVILNPSPIDGEIAKIDISKISVLVLNEHEAYDITGEKGKDKIYAYFTEKYKDLKVLLTLGSKGCMYFDCADGVKHFCPAFQVEVKDTTSAGDTFMGYFVSGLVKGLDIDETLRLASAASAIAVSRNGSSVSIPTADEVSAVKDSLKPLVKERA